jgi:hypothetical protein
MMWQRDYGAIPEGPADTPLNTEDEVTSEADPSL